jgi:hypothetical protein
MRLSSVVFKSTIIYRSLVRDVPAQLVPWLSGSSEEDSLILNLYTEWFTSDSSFIHFEWSTRKSIPSIPDSHQVRLKLNILLTRSTFPASNLSYCCFAPPTGICKSPRFSPSIARVVNSSSGIQILDNFSVVPCSKKACSVSHGYSEVCHRLRSWSSDSTRLEGHKYKNKPM